MKTTLITTVYNEEKTIDNFLKSVINQEKLPDELLIVDAGSNDKTTEKIQSFFKKYKKLNGKLFIKHGNRSTGRNEAIRRAKNGIILCSDVGCTLEKSWVEKISLPFSDKNIDVVSGFYKPVTKNIFQKAVAAYTSTMPDKVNPQTFLPSSRSVAFRKSAWKKAKGYPPELDTCEDLVFDKKLQKTGAKFYFQQSASVNWPQRKTFWQAAKQFFSYAKGDGKAHFFRKSTPLLFLRFIIGFFAVFAAISYHITKLELAIAGLFVIYLLWAVLKNFRYVKHPAAYIFLPTLQLISDITVLSGTTLGFLQSITYKKFIKQNYLLIFVILGYAIIVLTGIEWGIPNNNHPFNYHMDEWAQSQSIRDIFRHGTPNINGASHGAIFFYFLGGVYLIPFILLHVFNPFVIKNSLQHIAEQHRMFELLRINTLLWGIGTLTIIMYIAKKYLKTNSFISGVLFAVTPVFLVLSGYYKYDIGLVFWIVLSLLFTFRYSEKPTLKNFLALGCVSALTLAVKVSAIPILGTYVVAFFLFTPNWRKKLLYIPLGIAVFCLTFAVFGVPDLLLGIGDYGEWFHANLVSGPNETANYNIHGNYLLYLFGAMYPANFGIAFFPMFVFSTAYSVISILISF
ncbi:MAG: glycosyltransferase, partial [Patescibacteria group bacterium]|nr:glycosyltransferase [Patescibacteria group bacterium]